MLLQKMLFIYVDCGDVVTVWTKDVLRVANEIQNTGDSVFEFLKDFFCIFLLDTPAGVCSAFKCRV